MHNTSEMRDEAQAQALRTFAGNGFGDAAIGRTQPHVLLDSVELYHLARAHRSYKLREIVEAMLQAVGDFARQMVTRWKRQQQAQSHVLGTARPRFADVARPRIPSQRTHVGCR